MKQLTLPIEPTDPPTFGSYLPGPNEAALTALQGGLERWRTAPTGWLPPPQFLWGDGGCGKTHLLQALGQQWGAAGGQVRWFRPGEALPWEAPPSAALLLLDDAQDLDEHEQHAAFALFVQAAQHGHAIVAAADRPPVDLPLREDLRTRLGWGPVWQLQPLPDAALPGALRQEARRRGLTMSEELIGYMLVHCARDLRQLMDLLGRLDRYALSMSRPMTVPLFKQMLAEEAL